MPGVSYAGAPAWLQSYLQSRGYSPGNAPAGFRAGAFTGQLAGTPSGWDLMQSVRPNLSQNTAFLTGAGNSLPGAPNLHFMGGAQGMLPGWRPPGANNGPYASMGGGSLATERPEFANLQNAINATPQQQNALMNAGMPQQSPGISGVMRGNSIISQPSPMRSMMPAGMNFRI